MIRKIAIILLINFLFVGTVFAQNHIEITFEDYNDQDIFNNFSGDWNKWEHFPGTFSWSFDTTNCRVGHGTCLRVDYSVPQGNYGGIWNSLIGKVDFNNQYLDFTDLYRDLKNSSGNPTDIEDIRITQFSFWAKGNGIGTYNHTVKVEFKDTQNNVASKLFTIPNMSNWTKYTFPVSQISNIDLTHMKQVVFVLSDFQNDYRTSYFFLDDLLFSTTENAYDANTWSNDEFLDVVAHRAFKYFLTFTDDLGFALDRSTFSDLVSVGAIGFQLTAYCIGHKRGWADSLESRVENILQNLSSLPKGPEPGTVNAGYKGFFYHFLEANTGKRKNSDVELSLYDTMLLMQGILSVKECFPNNPNIQTLAQSLYDSVEWDWMVDTNPGDHQYQFHLAWKPETGFEGYVDGYTDEVLLVDVLALGSNTYPTTMETYNARSRFMGVYPPTSTDEIAAAWTGSLFNYFFASCWLDLQKRGIDKHETQPLNIWENNRRAIIANRQFCIDHQDNVTGDGDDKYTTYSELSWGLTAVDNLVPPSSGLLSEYYAFGALPTEQNIRFGTDAPHLGTIAVYGAGSSIMYTPSEAIEALRHYYSSTALWSPLFGFGDAYNTDPHYFEIDPVTFEPILDNNGNLKIHPATWLNGPWVNHMMMGIDEGPMLFAIENYRSGLIWNLTNTNPNIKTGLDSIFGPISFEHGHTSLNHNWNLVSLNNTYQNPVVIMGPPTYNGQDPGVIRVRNVSSNSFEVRFQEWLYKDGWHTQEQVSYLVINEGEHKLDGKKMKAGTFDLSGTLNWQSVIFPTAFSKKPILLLTCQTFNGADPVILRVRNLTASGFEVAIQEEEGKNDGHITETIGYLAIEKGCTELHLTQEITSNHLFTPLLSQQIKLEEEKSLDTETSHTQETIGALLIEKELFSQIQSFNGPDTVALRKRVPNWSENIEWGVVEGVNHSWMKVPLYKQYTEPVIIAKPVSNRGVDPGVIRLRNVSTNSFELRYQEWKYLDGGHTQERIFYLVAEAGIQDIGSPSLTVEAGKINSNSTYPGWETVDFSAMFSSPIVFTSVETFNGSDPVTTRINNVSVFGSEVTMQEEEGGDGWHTSESIGGIAIEAGETYIGGRKVKVFSNTANSSTTQINFGTSFSSNPVVVSDISTTNGSDPCFIRFSKVTPNYIKLFLAEEQSLDSETWHATENISLFVAD